MQLGQTVKFSLWRKLISCEKSLQLYWKPVQHFLNCKKLQISSEESAQNMNQVEF
jgi:hypothetical protein